MKKFLAAKVRSLYQIGQGEWDSEAYLRQGLTTYVNLYDFAKDPEVKAIAQYQNLAIWLNDKPVPFQFFLPKSAQVEIQAGKLFVKLERTWLAIAPINLQFGAVNTNLNKYSDEQILTTTAIDEKMSGFALEVGEAETHHTWKNFKRSILLNSKVKFNNRTAEYFSSKKKIKLQHQGRELPTLWRDGRFHDWRSHYDVYHANTKVPIYQAWKGGKLEVIAGGHHSNLSVLDAKN